MINLSLTVSICTTHSGGLRDQQWLVITSDFVSLRPFELSQRWKEALQSAQSKMKGPYSETTTTAHLQIVIIIKRTGGTHPSAPIIYASRQHHQPRISAVIRKYRSRRDPKQRKLRQAIIVKYVIRIEIRI